MPFALALDFDWLFGTFNFITGRVLDGTEPILLNEQVKCSFIDSSSMQNCYTGDGQFKCSGVGACTSDVSGESSKSLTWKSSCGGESSTTIDGNSEEVFFKCSIPSTTPVVSPLPATEPAIEQVKEQVKCTFFNSKVYQKCYSSDGKFACSGLESCSTGIFGAQGAMLSWKSSCGSESSTTIDGKDNELSFEWPIMDNAPVSVPLTPQICTDSDGTDHYVQGKSCMGANCEADRCDGNKLLEYFCNSNFEMVGLTFFCPNGGRVAGG